MPTFGSLFSGIGGLDLGLERAGWTCKWQVEIDDYASKVLEKHWPDVRRFRDVREVGKHNLESVELIVGGFPCQDISFAGKGAGIEGERSGLWSEFYRIICEVRPGIALVENVSALSHRGIERVLADLAEIGFDAEWETLPACAFGASHTRERLFIVAYASSERCLWRRDAGSGNGETESERRETTIRRAHGVFTPMGYSASRRIKSDRWNDQPAIQRVAYGVPDGMDRLRTIGNAVVPQVAQWIGERILEAYRR